MTRFPCPCCGHLTLPSGPGDYELCAVCFWEDDGYQLRYPLRADGANGISLVEAQRTYLRRGAMSEAFVRKTRSARTEEPLDEGWRPFDPALDWSNPSLDDDRWPVNPEALYYWRPTYWNGDQHKLPLPNREETNADRLLEHLRREIPELSSAIAESERRWGRASAFQLCGSAADLALSAYRDGDEERALRIVDSLVPALDEGSPLYSPNCVVIGFLENEAWHDPSIEHLLDRWPAPIRDEVRRQLQYVRESAASRSRHEAEWADLILNGRGLPVDVIVQRLRSIQPAELDQHPEMEMHRQVVARWISNDRWLVRHPLDSLRLAWKHRAVRSPWRTLTAIRRPRMAG